MKGLGWFGAVCNLMKRAGRMGKTRMHYSQWTTQAGREPLDDRRSPLADTIALTAEACGHPLSAPAADLLAEDLGRFDGAAVRAALARCRLELDGPLRLVEVLARLDDGRPDADEAWSMMPADERDSVVWTGEMAQAWGVAQPFIDAGDVAAAQAAFRKTYEKAVLEARIRREAPRWTPSLGLDVTGRERALRDAVRMERATAAQAALLLGYALGMSGEQGEFATDIRGNNNSLH